MEIRYEFLFCFVFSTVVFFFITGKTQSDLRALPSQKYLSDNDCNIYGIYLNHSRTKYSTKESRIATFNLLWPASIAITPEQFAEAGFFFLGMYFWVFGFLGFWVFGFLGAYLELIFS